jgi:hypothetical protein
VTTRTAIVAGLVCFVLVPAAQAQAPQPSDGPVPPRAIVRIVHANGLDPVGRPVREGPTYIVRAIDRRGLLMRVVVDARSGQIRAVNRIVPGPGGPGRVAMRPLPYGPPPEFDPPPVAPDDYSDLPPARPVRAPAMRPASRVSASATPPLPRPRPTNVVADAPPAAPPAETKPAAPAAAPAGKTPPPADAVPINE